MSGAFDWGLRLVTLLLLARVRDRSDLEVGGATPPAGLDASVWYRTLFAQSGLGVTVADSQRRLIDCNDAFCRIVGRPREELVGRPLAELNVPGDEDAGAAAVEALIAAHPR